MPQAGYGRSTGGNKSSNNTSSSSSGKSSSSSSSSGQSSSSSSSGRSSSSSGKSSGGVSLAEAERNGSVAAAAAKTTPAAQSKPAAVTPTKSSSPSSSSSSSGSGSGAMKSYGDYVSEWGNVTPTKTNSGSSSVSPTSNKPSNTQAGGAYQSSTATNDAQRTQEAIDSYTKLSDKDKLAAALGYAKDKGYNVSDSSGIQRTTNASTNTNTVNNAPATNSSNVDRANVVRQSFADQVKNFVPNSNTGGSSNAIADAVYHGLQLNPDDLNGADRYKNIMALQNTFEKSGLKYADNQDGAKEGSVKVVQPNGTNSLVSKKDLDNALRNGTPYYNPNGTSYADTTGQNYATTDQYGYTHGFDTKRNAAELNDYYQRLGQTTPFEAGQNAGNTYEYNGTVNGGYAVDDQGNRVNVGGITGSQPYLVGNDPKLGVAPTVNGMTGKQLLADALMGKTQQVAQTAGTGGYQGGASGVATGLATVNGTQPQTQTTPKTGGFQTYVVRDGQKLAATIDAQGVTTLSDGSRPQEGDIVQGRNQQYKVENGKGVVINQKQALANALTGKTGSGQPKAVNVTLADGTQTTGYISDGKTFMADGSRVPEGAVVDTGGGKYLMKNGVGTPYSENKDANAATEADTKTKLLDSLIAGVTNAPDATDADKNLAAEALAECQKLYPELATASADGTTQPAWSDAMAQAVAANKDQFAADDAALNEQLNQSLLASGLFGQLPGEVIKRQTMLQQQAKNSTANNAAATSIYNSAVQNYQYQQSLAQQKQSQFLTILQNTIERMTNDKQNSKAQALAVYNALLAKESAEATASYNNAKLQADTDYNNGKLTVDQQNAQTNAAKATSDASYKNSSLSIAQQNANANTTRANTAASTAVKGTASEQANAKQIAINNYISQGMKVYKTPNDMYAELERKGTGLPTGVTAIDVMTQLKKTYPTYTAKMGTTTVADKKNSPFYQAFPK